MNLWDILGTVLIGPLKVLFEVIFSLAYRMLGTPGPAILVLSVAMNVLVLPLYRRADAIQLQARDTENKLKPVVTHIKKTFSGDERMMILQTYYRQNHYSPLSVLTGSVSLLLEIPFFIAAYQFLSGVAAFRQASLGPIGDLSAPDGLMSIGGVTLNLLPIVMTLINVVSSSLYLKGFPLKTKIQLYGMALFFLVFLYNAPSALVLYWTLNNTFSLFKTLYYRLPQGRLALNVAMGLGGLGLVSLAFAVSGLWKTALVAGLGVTAQLVWLWPLIKKKLPLSQKPAPQPNTRHFLLAALFVTVLVGLFIPSTYVAASPQEFIDIQYFLNPIWYVVQTLCLTAGTFMVWMGVFYWLASPKSKVIFTHLLWILGGVMLTNYMFFGTNLGIVSADLQFTQGLSFSLAEHLINLAVLTAMAAAIYVLRRHAKAILCAAWAVFILALGAMGAVQSAQILQAAQESRQALESTNSDMPHFALSKTGQNVVIIMLDRGIGPFVPYIMEEKPQLLQQFDGFTYYANTLSYGGFTNFGTPPLYGGYEYTPVQMNLRDQEKLVDKHNEALKVMPTLFAEQDYDVTLIDPSYAGYRWIPDLSIYRDMEGVNAYLADGRFNDANSRLTTLSARMRNFFFFSLMKTLPVSLQAPVYNHGQYNALPAQEDTVNTATALFLNAYNVLKNMGTMTQFTQEDQNTFMFLRSNATHEPVLLSEPDYQPSAQSPTVPADKVLTDGQGNTLTLSGEWTISHYHVNMAAFLRLGEWFDTLRQNGVYDNTRIILVSDHGNALGLFDQDEKGAYYTELYRPLLMVKDFGAKGFATSQEFMTNADVPTLATQELIEDPVNPFTGLPVNSLAKTQREQHYVILSSQWDINQNNGNQFLPSEWASVPSGADVNDKKSWTYYKEQSVLPTPLQK